MKRPNNEKLIFEQGRPGRTGIALPTLRFTQNEFDVILPPRFRRKEIAGFPEVAESETVRHFTRLADENVGVDDTMIPLGSCTMGYNPKGNEVPLGWEGIANLHPMTPVVEVGGMLKLLWRLEQMLCEICGMDAFTLNPVAGAHGEMTGLKIIRAAFRARGEERPLVLIPDSAHGTNPASAKLAGFTPVSIAMNEDGSINLGDIKKHLDSSVAAMMITNPSTFGLFESHIKEIADVLHANGSYLYCDGANFNAFIGMARMGDMGYDVVQLNPHKTLKTPHASSGPAAGPVGVVASLISFLPFPRIRKYDSERNWYYTEIPSKSIGRIHSYYGNVAVLIRAYMYLRSMGAEGLREVAENAVLNANYLRVKLVALGFHIPFDRVCMHEVLLTDKNMPNGITALDIAKRLIDYGFHPPTVYFPKMKYGTLLIEPTETETKETIDEFIMAMATILEEAKNNPELLHDAPHYTSVRRIDEAKANRYKTLDLRWTPTTS